MEYQDKFQKFRELLNTNYTWPDYYVFKFIVKSEQQVQVLDLLTGHEVTVKKSDKGNYVSITSRLLINHTEEVLIVYRLVGEIPGVMSF